MPKENLILFTKLFFPNFPNFSKVPNIYVSRRMFPTVKVSFTNVILDALYYIFLDVVPVDSKR